MSKVLTGSRSVLRFTDPTNNSSVVVGIFESVSWSYNQEVDTPYVLGSAIPKEVTPLGFSPVQVQCSGFRLLDQGPYVAARFPTLQAFLTQTPFDMECYDRATGRLVLKVKNCTATSYSGGFNSRATSRISCSFVGLSTNDESGDQQEVDGVDFP